MDNKRLYIMRGIPGSGKSSKAKDIYIQELDRLFDNRIDGFVEVVSADDFHIVGPYLEQYEYIAEHIDLAHKWCQGQAAYYMRHNCVVVVDNTNTTFSEMQPYFELAARFGYEVIIVEPSSAWAFDAEECFKRNTHGVPLDTIKKMLQRYQRIKITHYEQPNTKMA